MKLVVCITKSILASRYGNISRRDAFLSVPIAIHVAIGIGTLRKHPILGYSESFITEV